MNSNTSLMDEIREPGAPRIIPALEAFGDAAMSVTDVIARAQSDSTFADALRKCIRRNRFHKDDASVAREMLLTHSAGSPYELMALPLAAPLARTKIPTLTTLSTTLTLTTLTLTTGACTFTTTTTTTLTTSATTTTGPAPPGPT